VIRDLKQRTIRGGLAKTCSQGTNFLLRLASLMILARLLDPKDFGLVGMVTAVIGIFSVFRDFGLSAATVQRKVVTEEQLSTLFWINLLVGGILGLIALAVAPVVVKYYHEPRLLGITAALATGFLFNSAGVQHAALLERQMRFTTLSVIDVASLVTSSAVGVGMAMRGYGYWSLVATAIISPLAYTVFVWLATAWIPGRPHQKVGVRSMMRFGGTLTFSSLVMYVASNLEKVLLGRFWGVDAIGIYGRAYQLINIPTENLNSSAGAVAFAALSRVQNKPGQFRSYFLKGYSLVLSLTVPITFCCAVFADDIISVFLGAKWRGAIAIFRLLAPTTLAFAILNPFGWLLSSLGLVGRNLKINLVLAPVMIAGYLLGLPYGPKGVAFAYSAVMILCIIPLTCWAVHSTVVSVRDILGAVGRPLCSCMVAVGVAGGLQLFYGPLLSPLPRLAIGVALVFGTYLAMLLLVMGQGIFYLDILRAFVRRSPVEDEILEPA
jgi:O-antigen/teichoic acid export membrane protein